MDTPVILAPMAGITNSAFRRLCREYGGGLYVAEMVTSRALVERTPESLRIISHDEDEKVRSVFQQQANAMTVAITGVQVPPAQVINLPGDVSVTELGAIWNVGAIRA